MDIPEHAPGHEGFSGTVGRTFADSRPSWPRERRARGCAPNLVVVLVGDLGYRDIGPFGSEIHTPALDRLAARGVRPSRSAWRRSPGSALAWTRVGRSTGAATQLTGHFPYPGKLDWVRCEPPIAIRGSWPNSGRGLSVSTTDGGNFHRGSNAGLSMPPRIPTHDVGHRPWALTETIPADSVLSVNQAVYLTTRRHVDLRRHAGACCRAR